MFHWKSSHSLNRQKSNDIGILDHPRVINVEHIY